MALDLISLMTLTPPFERSIKFNYSWWPTTRMQFTALRRKHLEPRKQLAIQTQPRQGTFGGVVPLSRLLICQPKQVKLRRVLQLPEGLLNLLQRRGSLQVDLLPYLLGVEILREQCRKGRLRMRSQHGEEKLRRGPRTLHKLRSGREPRFGISTANSLQTLGPEHPLRPRHRVPLHRHLLPRAHGSRAHSLPANSTEPHNHGHRRACNHRTRDRLLNPKTLNPGSTRI
jgi:hypothetical protein